MRTAEERLALLHRRADLLEKKKELALLKALGGVSGSLAVCLLALFTLFGQGGHGIASSGYAATSLLSEHAGGYVLAALIAFALGVVVTVALIRHGKKETGKDNMNRDNKEDLL